MVPFFRVLSCFNCCVFLAMLTTPVQEVSGMWSFFSRAAVAQGDTIVTGTSRLTKEVAENVALQSSKAIDANVDDLVRGVGATSSDPLATTTSQSAMSAQDVSQRTWLEWIGNAPSAMYEGAKNFVLNAPSAVYQGAKKVVQPMFDAKQAVANTLEETKNNVALAQKNFKSVMEYIPVAQAKIAEVVENAEKASANMVQFQKNAPWMVGSVAAATVVGMAGAMTGGTVAGAVAAKNWEEKKEKKKRRKAEKEKEKNDNKEKNEKEKNEKEKQVGENDLMEQEAKPSEDAMASPATPAAAPAAAPALVAADGNLEDKKRRLMVEKKVDRINHGAATVWEFPSNLLESPADMTQHVPQSTIMMKKKKKKLFRS